MVRQLGKIALVADSTVKKWGSKPTRHPVKAFGGFWKNRHGLPCSGGRVKTLLKNVYDEEGFSELRLGVPIVLRLKSQKYIEKLHKHNVDEKARDDDLPKASLEEFQSSKGPFG